MAEKITKLPDRRANLPAVVVTPSRFEAARQDAAEAEALMVAADLCKAAKEALARAESLFKTSSAMIPAPRAAARLEAVRGVRIAAALLAEIGAEFDA